MVTPVQDPNDERIAPYREAGNGRVLRERGIFVAEGRLVVQRLIEDGRYTVESVLVTPAAYASLARLLEIRDLPVFVCAPEVVRQLTGFDFHRGCLALAERPATTGSLGGLLTARRLLVLQGVGNPDNIGGIFRAALAFGAGGVILDERSGDPLYRKAIRTSMAATLRVPFARMTLPEAVAAMKRNGFQVIALTPAPDAVDVGTLGRVSKMALLLGSEGDGLSPDVFEIADVRARIPIDAAADSLNVAVAAAVALHALG